VPAPKPGERVVFIAHFERGFGLPASDFFRDFLDTYDLQPHHIPANAVMILSAFATFEFTPHVSYIICINKRQKFLLFEFTRLQQLRQTHQYIKKVKCSEDKISDTKS
jgi:hypothetical protein